MKEKTYYRRNESSNHYNEKRRPNFYRNEDRYKYERHHIKNRYDDKGNYYRSLQEEYDSPHNDKRKKDGKYKKYQESNGNNSWQSHRPDEHITLKHLQILKSPKKQHRS